MNRNLVVVAADTGDDVWVLDPDDCVVYIDHEQDAEGFAAAARAALLVLQLGPKAVPGTRRANQPNLQLVSGCGGGAR